MYWVSIWFVLVVIGGSAFVGRASADVQPPKQWTAIIGDREFQCNEDTCETSPIELPFLTDMIVLQAEAFEGVRMRYQSRGGWSGWRSYEGESDVPDGEDDVRPYALISLDEVRVIQIQKTREQRSMTIIALGVPKRKEQQDAHVRMAVEQNEEMPRIASILPRSQWLDDGIALPRVKEEALWTREYAQDKKFIIHHTATVIRDANSDGVLTREDYREAIRAIYLYHAYTRGWGDIGYNYIIDPEGTIWEGRAGGDGVVAGHTKRSPSCTKFGKANIGFNDGSIGIAFLGTYDTQGISIAAYDALVRFVAQKSWEFNVDPSESGFFKDAAYPNVVGHRDIDCTDCPGKTIAAGLPDITRAAKAQYDILSAQYPRRFAGQRIDAGQIRVDMKADEERVVSIQYRNIGTVAWRNYGSEKISLARGDITRHIAAIDSVRMATVDENGKDAHGSQESSSPKDYLVAELETPNVNPGEIGTFILRIPKTPEEYHSTQKFVLAVGEQGWLKGSETEVVVTNTGLEYAAEYGGGPSVALPDNEHVRIQLRFINRGTKGWNRGEVLLALSDSGGGAYRLADDWKSKEGTFTFNEKTVGPGETATFTIPLFGTTLEDVSGRMSLYRGTQKISGSDEQQILVSVVPSYSIEIAENTIQRIIQSTWRPTAKLTIKNMGTREIKNAQLVVLGGSKKSSPLFYHPSWESRRIIDTVSIKPGKTATVIFTLKPPTKGDEYELRLALKQDTKDVYIAKDGGLTKELKQRILVDEPAKILKKNAKK